MLPSNSLVGGFIRQAIMLIADECIAAPAIIIRCGWNAVLAIGAREV